MLALSENAAMDALADDPKLKLQQLGERYVRRSGRRKPNPQSAIHREIRQMPVARIAVVKSDGSRLYMMVKSEFVAMPAPGDRLMVSTDTPDSPDPFRVMFVEHCPAPHPRSDRDSPPTATIVVEPM